MKYLVKLHTYHYLGGTDDADASVSYMRLHFYTRMDNEYKV